MSHTSKISKKAYNTSALEAWFGHLLEPWEGGFDSVALETGRNYYKDGLVVSLELSTTDAIITCQFGRRDTAYAVIEFKGARPKVRGSTDNEAQALAVAVAGLYEIEELVADEMAPVAPPLNAAIENALETAGGPEASEADAPSDGETAAVRSLLLVVDGVERGLRLQAFWLSGDGSRDAALGSGAIWQSGAEREKLVRLTGKARDAGFMYDRKGGAFHLNDPSRIGPFFSHALARWQMQFGQVEIAESARVLARGPRDLKVIGRVEVAGKGQMRVDWRLRLGDHWLQPLEAESILRRGRGVHVVPGLGLAQIREEQAASLRDWKLLGGKCTDDLREWPRYMMYSLFGQQGVEFDVEKEMAAWREGLQNRGALLAGRVLPKELRPYQRQGVAWLVNLVERGCHGLLADEMGLGKTLQVLSLLEDRAQARGPALIVCPASVVPVWLSEAARWFPKLRISVLRRGHDFVSAEDAAIEVWVASYTQLRRHRHLLEEIEFSHAVLDEAQQIKNPDAKVTQACCAIRAECRLALSGTPLENRTLDIWTLFRFLMPGLLGPRARFEAAAESPDLRKRKHFHETLRRQLAPFVLRRKKAEVLQELPEKVEIDLICPISARQRQVYDSILAEGRSVLEAGEEDAAASKATHVFTLLTRLRQACCDPGLIPGQHVDLSQSGKIQSLLVRLREALEAVEGRKIVIFSQFVGLLNRLKTQLKTDFPGVPVYELNGGTKNRGKPVDQFQTGEGSAIILVSLRAGGTGITLHAADYVFVLDPWWNPAVERQAVDRVHRLGQQRKVFIYRLITEGTVEERIQHLKADKRQLFEETVGQLGAKKPWKAHYMDVLALAGLTSSAEAEDASKNA